MVGASSGIAAQEQLVHACRGYVAFCRYEHGGGVLIVIRSDLASKPSGLMDREWQGKVCSMVGHRYSVILLLSFLGPAY